MRAGVINALKALRINIISKRNLSSKHQKCVSLIYEETGDPLNSIEIVESVLEAPQKNEVLVRMLASPINPADINMIQGVYPIKPKLPAIGGNEGVGEVLEVGSKVKNLKKGDRVIPVEAGWGTWRSHAVCPAESLICVSPKLSIIGAATIAINPCTAYRMLKDFSELERGDVVIQNAANGAVGQAVIQVAKEMGLRTVNVVRKRPSVDELIEDLEELGGTHVVTDEFARSPEMKGLFIDLPKPKLGLNSVGGKAVMDIVKHLDNGSSLVTYGGMSKQPVMLATGAFIFKDLRAHGFWMTQWTANNEGSPAQKQMFEWLTSLTLEGKLRPPKHEMRALSEYREALKTTMEGFHGCKQVLNFDALDV